MTARTLVFHKGQRVMHTLTEDHATVEWVGKNGTDGVRIITTPAYSYATFCTFRFDNGRRYTATMKEAAEVWVLEEERQP